MPEMKTPFYALCDVRGCRIAIASATAASVKRRRKLTHFGRECVV
jgi:hypothetical protein